ncbi:MAG: hypothetical protein HY908_36945 [Myxococcales bacterium]|nr:hypothetical protein [Myxococcales bacterium]
MWRTILRVARAAGGTAGLALGASACAPPCPQGPQLPWAAGLQPAAPVPASGPAAVPAPGAAHEPVAVLPLEDDGLFRAERAELRQLLALGLARVATDYAILPLLELDAKLAPVSRATGARCAFDRAPGAERARRAGWHTTDVLHVAGSDGRSDELWVRLADTDGTPVETFTAPWDATLELAARYRRAFGALAASEGAGLLGGLFAGDGAEGALRDGPVTLCEGGSFGTCAASSPAWRDRVGELAACFAGEDAAAAELLLEPGAPARCEIVDLERLEGREGARESCLCRALSTSAALGMGPERRKLRVAFEASDLAGKPRPGMRVVDATTNLESRAGWLARDRSVAGKVEHGSVRRLEIEHLDALAAPLARCTAPTGSVAVAEVAVREDGAVTGARVVGGLAAKDAVACVEQALVRGAFDCTNDGRSAELRVAIAWP